MGNPLQRVVVSNLPMQVWGDGGGVETLAVVCRIAGLLLALPTPPVHILYIANLKVQLSLSPSLSFSPWLSEKQHN